MKKFSQINEASPTREKINLSSHPYLKYLFDENIDGYDLINKEESSFDGEKGFVDYDIIIQRKSDGKFFKGEATDYGRHEREVDPNFREVFPRQKTITVYE